MLLTLGELQEKMNTEFYSKAKDIKSVFSTFAGCRNLQKARAINFLRRIGNRKMVRIAEIGVGEGTHARLFLESLRELGYAGTVEIHFYDISDLFLGMAEKNAKGIADRIVKKKVDLTRGKKFLEGRFDLIVFHEMLDDLPTEMLIRKGKEIREVRYRSKLECPVVGRKRNGITIPRLLEGYLIPFNFIAERILGHAVEHLGKNGYVEATDYGFTYESMDAPEEMWNLNSAREIDGHATVDINFSGIRKALEKKAKVTLMPQKQFAEEQIGEMLLYAEVKNNPGYFTLEQANRIPELNMMLKLGITELDNYFYLLLEKQ